MKTYQITQIITRIAFVEAPNKEDANEQVADLSDFDYETDNIEEIVELVAK
jgi:hypothetical protein